MIGRLSGKLVERDPPTIVLDVNGVGYEVDVPMSTYCILPRTGETVTLQTHMVVREDAQLLYGFATEGERRAFRRLLKISGVGPRIALAILSGMSVPELAAAVVAQKADRLTKVPGIGRKTAERLLLELQDVSGWSDGAPEPAGTAAAIETDPDIVKALMALGYNDRQAQQAVSSLPPDISLADGIRQALRLLSR